MKSNKVPIIVEGQVYPVEPVEILGFEGPTSDQVISVLLLELTSRANTLQIQLLEQVEKEVKRARRSEISARQKVILFHDLYVKSKNGNNAKSSVNSAIDFGDVTSFTEEQRLLIKNVAIWIRTSTLAEVDQNGLEHCLHKNEVLSDADINKSALFARVCSGKPPIVHIPPTAFGQPWYELLESSEGLDFPVQVEESRALLEKLLHNEFDELVDEVILINKCEWKIKRVVKPGHEYELNWPHTSYTFLLKRSDNLLSSDKGSEQGWVLHKYNSKGI